MSKPLKKNKRVIELEKIYQLSSERIILVASIECDNCKKIDKTQLISGTYSAAEEFYRKGWRPGATNTYCRKCAKKKLKS